VGSSHNRGKDTLFVFQQGGEVKVKLFLCLTKYHAMKMQSLLH
jgi:hypothetical protein